MLLSRQLIHSYTRAFLALGSDADDAISVTCTRLIKSENRNECTNAPKTGPTPACLKSRINAWLGAACFTSSISILEV